MPSVTRISGFLPLPVQYDHDTFHMLYIRAHVGGSSKNAKKAQWPEDRTIFMVNAPPDATEREVVSLFKSCGTVEQVVFDADGPSETSDVESDEDSVESEASSPSQSHARKKRKTVASGSTSEPKASLRGQRPKVEPLPIIPLRTFRRTGQTAHIIFLDASSCTRALALAHAHPGAKPILWPTNADKERPRGLAHYIKQYESARPPLDAVRAHADSAIARFDFDLAARRASLRRESKYKKGEALVDEDGFTLVVRGGAYGQAVGGGVGVASRKFMDEYVKGLDGKESGSKGKRHKEGKEKAGFYAFQIHEKKRNALLKLKRNWEKDKAAVETLKATRKYRPY
ncbi:ribosomal RNA-processing protein 7-domain-containing protein [Russula ochroleuca]|uniref:Ribosomal RNA-processing protein 7-domain-containing protein n=1 Tax=Russula ochroleuca TaxID=152965 RepID=A0A9P5JUK7_9AGAM|nr:ribosomal RNA-processing protein 7-domain-containing protein [Russula ochroleuca]